MPHQGTSHPTQKLKTRGNPKDPSSIPRLPMTFPCLDAASKMHRQDVEQLQNLGFSFWTEFISQSYNKMKTWLAFGMLNSVFWCAAVSNPGWMRNWRPLQVCWTILQSSPERPDRSFSTERVAGSMPFMMRSSRPTNIHDTLEPVLLQAHLLCLWRLNM